MKYILLILLLLISCDYNQPCEDNFELLEPGGFGRNKVSFLINDTIVWYAEGSGAPTSGMFGGVGGSSGGFSISRFWKKDKNGNTLRDSNGYIIKTDTLALSFTSVSKARCEKNDYFRSDFKLEVSNFSVFNTIPQSKALRVIGYNSPSYYNNTGFNLKTEVFINTIDSICWGTFEGELYNYRTDSILMVTNGVFDYKYKSLE